MQTLIENLINGNLKDARRQAKGFSCLQIAQGLASYGHSARKAALGAAWLKTGEGWQAYCDAE